jgi:hypothetical protein
LPLFRTPSIAMRSGMPDSVGASWRARTVAPRATNAGVPSPSVCGARIESPGRRLVIDSACIFPSEARVGLNETT